MTATYQAPGGRPVTIPARTSKAGNTFYSLRVGFGGFVSAPSLAPVGEWIVTVNGESYAIDVVNGGTVPAVSGVSRDGKPYTTESHIVVSGEGLLDDGMVVKIEGRQYSGRCSFRIVIARQGNRGGSAPVNLGW